MARTPNRARVKLNMRDTGGPGRLVSAWFAAAIAFTGAATLAVDFTRSLVHSLSKGQTVAEAVFAYVRFFTILTNGGVAALMALTAIALWRRAVPPPASAYRAALVYMIVTCAAYEVLLRHLWSPQGLQFVSDLIFHDVQPALTVLFWMLCAPKAELRWTTLPWLLLYPLLYFIVTIVAGQFGAGYPYNFLDAATLGYPAVLGIGLAFLCVFLGFGALATSAARLLRDGRPATASRRSSSCR